MIRYFMFVAMLMLAPLPLLAAEGYIGERECNACHKPEKRSYQASHHGQVFGANPRGDLQAKGCEACHGPGAKHAQMAGDETYKGPWFIENFRNEDGSASSGACLQCHESGQRLHWQGSGHDMAGVNCSACHTLHSGSPGNAAEKCGSCHVQQRAMMQRSSHVPVREGRMGCTSCHNPHGGSADASLIAASVNETCHECHAEKRGPVIWEHAPVRENCANCHNPHGSIHGAMLKTRAVHLCQQCHANTRHPSSLYDGADFPSGEKHSVGRGCVNCHAQIHGSNHPSGQFFQR